MYEDETKDDVEVFQSVEIINKAPIFNIFELMAQTPFIRNELDDNNEIKYLLKRFDTIAVRIVPHTFS